MENSRNIIFDFGTILINLDYTRTFDAFKALGVDNIEQLFAYGRQQAFFDQLEIGGITATEFYDYIRALAGKALADVDIAQAWNAMLLDFPPHRVEMLKTLKAKGYRLFLLSNTNEIHKNDFRATLKAQYGFDIFADLFEKAYFSSEIGMRKPNTNIYEHVLKENGLNPAETIFIDDVEENLPPAKTLGITTYHIPKGQEVADLFKPIVRC